jgi:hypothetical protein
MKNKNEIDELINKIRGTTPSSELQKEVEAVIKADEEKAKLKAEADKKKLADIKAAEKKLKEDAIKEAGEKKKKKLTGQEEEEKSEEDSEEEETDSDAIIKKLTEDMAKMAEEIDALKKRKNYRTPPPKGKKVDEQDDFIRQNITKDFEMVV